MDIIDEILRREGGYVDDPSDRGGCTNWGVTRTTLAAWRHRSVTCEDVKNLTQDEAREIYRDMYIRQPGFNRIQDERLRNLVVDAGVNHGTHQATRFLQKAAGVATDGIIGPITLSAVNSDPFPSRVYNRVLAERIRFYGRIITDRPANAKFAAGWMNRVTEFLE